MVVGRGLGTNRVNLSDGYGDDVGDATTGRVDTVGSEAMEGEVG